MNLRPQALVGLFVSACLFGSVSVANACSVCIAHALGAGIYGIGAQTLRAHQSVFSIGYLTSGKSQDGEVEFLQAHRCSPGVGFGISRRRNTPTPTTRIQIRVAEGFTQVLRRF